ncbi:hypothetical protein [Peribacillus glennii]|uniref:Uncharacterized protein n=1 Tax=Peribacillus glennii TaxID=2303991 RepID=A0A372L816_9BACI|nr:hypothetical protein [Peribacillus glennii]RFU61436.1 hypothetical protein D0466_18310 [Peribacillus glennii]
MDKENKHCGCPCHDSTENTCPKDGFCCPGRIPASVPNDQFCTPFNCPKPIPTPRFNSPNSPLPPNELNKLQACIEEINDTLRTIGNPREPGDPNQRQLQLHFRALRYSLVKVVVDCHNQEMEILGILEEAGANFIQVNTLDEKKFIPFEKICFLKHEDARSENIEHEQELLKINTCIRRDITLNFGEIVGRSPELINLFFGIPLHLFLQSFLGCEIEVKSEADEELLRGILCSVDEDQFRIQLCVEEMEEQKEKQEEEPIDPCKQEEDGIHTVNFNEVCFITVDS